jgi:hypothetical protein
MARGRPRKAYAQLDLAHDDEVRLAAHLRATILWDGYPLKTLTAPWYVPAADERLGDSLTLKWCADYQVRFLDDWKRMLRTLRKSGGSTTWTQATAVKKSRRDVPELATGNSALSDGDDPVYLQDLAHVMALYPGMNRAQKHKRQPLHRYQSFGDGAFIDPDEPAEVPIYVAFVLISEADDSVSAA